MHWHLLILPATMVLSAALAPSPPQLEEARLQAHFDSVDAELRHAKGPQLTSGQRMARATLIGWLQQYRNAGEFPQNERFANLRNNAFIAELADDLALRAWLDSVGLSVNEAARIQPTYAPKVEAYVAQYDSAWSRRDTSAVSRILAPKYRYFTSRGGVSSRAESIAMLSDPDYRLERASRSEITVALSGPVAVVSSRWKGQGTYRGQQFKDDQRCGQTWLLSGAHRETRGAGELADTREWQLLSEHCVQIAPGSAPASPD